MTTSLFQNFSDTYFGEGGPVSSADDRAFWVRHASRDLTAIEAIADLTAIREIVTHNARGTWTTESFADHFAGVANDLIGAVRSYADAPEGSVAEVPDRYSEDYGYARFPVRFNGRPVSIDVWPTEESTSPGEGRVVIRSRSTIISASFGPTDTASRIEEGQRPEVAEGDSVVLVHADGTRLTVTIEALPGGRHFVVETSGAVA